MLDTPANSYLADAENMFSLSFIIPKGDMEEPKPSTKELLKLPKIIRPDAVIAFEIDDVDTHFGFRFEYSDPRAEFDGMTIRDVVNRLNKLIEEYTQLSVNYRWVQ